MPKPFHTLQRTYARLEGWGQHRCWRPHASRRIAARIVRGNTCAPSRCDAPQHEGRGT